MAHIATKHDILASQDWDTTTFDVEKWGTVKIRSLSAKERLDLVKLAGGKDGHLANEDAMRFYATIIALSMIDDMGQPVFDATSEDDINALQNRAWARLEEVATRIMRFNGMHSDAQEELSKN